jgi:hypothetical protein
LNKKIILKNRCFKLEILYMAIREKEKLRNLGMVFKPSLKLRLYPEKIGFWVWVLDWVLYSNPYQKNFIPKPKT